MFSGFQAGTRRIQFKDADATASRTIKADVLEDVDGQEIHMRSDSPYGHPRRLSHRM